MLRLSNGEGFGPAGAAGAAGAARRSPTSRRHWIQFHAARSVRSRARKLNSLHNFLLISISITARPRPSPDDAGICRSGAQSIDLRAPAIGVRFFRGKLYQFWPAERTERCEGFLRMTGCYYIHLLIYYVLLIGGFSRGCILK